MYVHIIYTCFVELKVEIVQGKVSESIAFIPAFVSLTLTLPRTAYITATSGQLLLRTCFSTYYYYYLPPPSLSFTKNR